MRLLLCRCGDCAGRRAQPSTFPPTEVAASGRPTGRSPRAAGTFWILPLGPMGNASRSSRRSGSFQPATRCSLRNAIISSKSSHRAALILMGNVGNTIKSYAEQRYQLNFEILWSRMQRAIQSDKDFAPLMQQTKTQFDFLLPCCALTCSSYTHARTYTSGGRYHPRQHRTFMGHSYELKTGHCQQSCRSASGETKVGCGRREEPYR